MNYADISVHKKNLQLSDMTISSTFPLRTVFGFVSLIKKDLGEIQALHNQHRMSAYPLRKCFWRT